MMQVSETRTDGLKRELKVTVPASELEARLSKRLDELKGRIRLNGFRPGKVPIGHIRKVYGKAAMAEVVEALVGETTEKALSDRGEKVSMRPRVDMAEEVEADRILSGDADLSFTMAYEVLPDFEVADYKGIRIERPVAPIADEEIDARLKRLAEGARSYSPVERPAGEGDRVTFSFVGRIDGKEFEGGTQEDANVVIGSGMLIGGLEDGLKGVSAGDEKTIEATFPETYPVPVLAGKPATFEVKVKEVSAPETTELDDEVAKRLGMESLDTLRGAIRAQIENEQGLATRQKVKRQLLDALDDLHSFSLPSNLVDQEFENIWRQVAHAVEHHGHKFEDEGTTEEEARAEYRRIAERRVRLGLVLSRIGEGAGIQVTDEELQRALYAQMRRFPGQEQQVIDFYRNDAGALQGLRAPIYEEKVVDLILELADMTDKDVTREELMADLEDEDEHVHHHHEQDDDEHDHEAHDHDHEAHAGHHHDHDHDDHDHEQGAAPKVDRDQP